MTLKKDLKFWLSAAFVLSWYLYWTAPGIRTYFVPDDLLAEYYYWNRPLQRLIVANLIPFTNYYRPLGGAWYHTMFTLFGFNPLPFHLFSYSIQLVNLWLAFRVTARISGSAEIGGLAVLIGGVHALFADLYYSTGSIYDVIACFLYLTAFLYYLRIRQAGLALTWKNTAVLLAIYLLAINAKEIAATLPATLGVYELLFHTPAIRRFRDAVDWARRELRGVLAIGLITPIVAYAKMRPGRDQFIAGQGAYTWVLTWDRYLTSTAAYFNTLFYSIDKFTQLSAVLLLLLTLALAWAFRSRVMLYAWCFSLLAVVPISFIPARSGFCQYIQMVGLALYAASLLGNIRDLLVPNRPALRTLSQCVLFLGFALAYAPTLKYQFFLFIPAITGKEERMRSNFTQFRELCPTLPKGVRILFLDDMLDDNEYTLLFFLRIYYHDVNLVGDRVKVDKSLAAKQSEYDRVFTLQQGKVIDVTPPRTPVPAVLKLGPLPQVQTILAANVF